MLRPMSRIPSVLILAGAAGAVLLPGCVGQTHDLRLGGVQEIETFAPRSEPLETSPLSDPSLAQRPWPEMTLLVPNDGVRNRPVYRTQYLFLNQNRRQRGEFPTPESALDLETGAYGEHLLDAFVIHDAGSVVDGGILLPRLFLYPPWTRRGSPRITYDRAPDPSLMVPRATEEPAAESSEPPGAESPEKDSGA